MSALPLELAVPPVTEPLRLVAREPGVDPVGETFVAEAEAAIERHEYVQALASLDGISPPTPRLALRALLAQSWALMELGELDDAVKVLERARSVAERAPFGAVDAAEVLYRLGCCRLKLSSVASAAALLTVAIDLCDRSAAGCDRLRARILERRARCYGQRRDWEAAREDVERALELAESLGDDATEALVRFQASIVAERQSQWLLARCYAEQALMLYERCGDRLNTHRVLNNLGGIHFLLGSAESGAKHLGDAFRIALELGDDVAAAYSMSSLAQLQVRSGDAVVGESHARRALELLAGREDHIYERGNAQLVLARALLDQGRADEATEVLRVADASFERAGSTSERAAVWMAEGDVASAVGDKDCAARAYKRAAEALQDFHF